MAARSCFGFLAQLGNEDSWVLLGQGHAHPALGRGDGIEGVKSGRPRPLCLAFREQAGHVPVPLHGAEPTRVCLHVHVSTCAFRHCSQERAHTQTCTGQRIGMYMRGAPACTHAKGCLHVSVRVRVTFVCACLYGHIHVGAHMCACLGQHVCVTVHVCVCVYACVSVCS